MSERNTAFGLDLNSPLVPEKLSLNDTFKFRCHENIACFNECCKNINIDLTPYDIIRLKNHFNIDSREFLASYTVPFETDGHGMPGVKMKTRADTSECPFLTTEGCGVYQNRPSACRYYALGLMSMRASDKNEDETHYFVVKEDHCLGHNEDKTQTIAEYRKNQGVESYDDINREWRQLVLKKRSCGPTIGNPSKRSFQMYFMACYNIDSFRDFVFSDGFATIYSLEASFYEIIKNDEIQLLQFAFRLMKQVLFGENTIPLQENAMEQHLASRKPKEKLQDQNKQPDLTMAD